MREVTMKINKPRKTFNISIPLDLKVNDVLGMLWTMFVLIDGMRCCKPTVKSHDYAVSDGVSDWMTTNLGIDMDDIARNLIATGYKFSSKSRKDGFSSCGGTLVIGSSWEIDDQGKKHYTIQTKFGKEIDAFLDGTVDIAGAFKIMKEEMDDWIEKNHEKST